MFRHLFATFLLSLLWLNLSLPVVLAERSELDKQIESFHDTKDEKDFAGKVNRIFQSENSLESFLGDSDVWERLNHYKQKFNEEYQTILKVFTTENNADGTPSGIAILVDKIQVGDSLEDLDSSYSRCVKHRDDLAEKGMHLRSIGEKIFHIDSQIQENVSSELDKLHSNDEVVKSWKNIQRFPVVYKLTGSLFADKYVSSLSGTSSELLASWQSAKTVIPQERQEELKEALIDKISLTIQEEVKTLDSTSGLLAYWNELKRKDPDGLVQNSQAVIARLEQTAPFDLTGANTEEILTKWNSLANSEDFNTPSAKEFQDSLKLIVNRNLINQFPKDISSLSSLEQFAYWTKLNVNEIFKEIVSESTLTSFRNDLEKQMLAAFEKEIPSFKNCDDCLAQWKEFQDNLETFCSPDLGLIQKLVQTQLINLLPENLNPRKTEILALLQKNFPEFNPALERELALVQTGLDGEALATWKNEIKGKKALEVVQMWKAKNSESGLTDTLKNSIKLAAQTQLDESFMQDLKDVEPAFTNYITFQTEQKNGGTFDLAFNSENLISHIESQAVEAWKPELETIRDCENVAKFWFEQKETPFFKQIQHSDQTEMQEAVIKRIQECFVEDWKKVQNPSFTKYIALLDKLQATKIFELDDLESQKEAISESFTEAWEEELSGKSPSEIISLWESVKKLPYFELLPKSEMRDLMASQFGICLQNEIPAIKSCEDCSEYLKTLTESMLKVDFKPSAGMKSMLVDRFEELLDESIPENKNSSLPKIKDLKTRTNELFHPVLDEKYQQTKVTLTDNYLDWWKKHLVKLTCAEMLDAWEENENEFRTYEAPLQKELKIAYDKEFSERFADELEKNGQNCANCISFWQNLLAHNFVPENEEDEQILQIFTKTLDSETPSNLNEAEKFLTSTLQSVPENSMFKPILNNKLALVQNRLAEQKEYLTEIPKLVQNLRETPQGITQFEKNIQKFETKFPEFAVYKALHELDQKNLDSFNTIFNWNRMCENKSFSQEQTNSNFQLIPEWKNFTSASSPNDFITNDIQLKNDLMSFFISTRVPHWSQYPYNGNDYYITPSQIQNKTFGVVYDEYGGYSTTATIQDPSLIKDAYHHEVFNDFIHELNQISNDEIQNNPQILYNFICNSLNTLKADSRIHPAYAAYGVYGILKTVQKHSTINPKLGTTFCLLQNGPLMENFETNFDLSRFKKVVFFNQTDRSDASDFLKKSVIPKQITPIAKPEFTPYHWVGVVDSEGNFLTNTQSNEKNLLMIKNGKLVPAEKGSTGSLLFSHQKK